MWATPEYMTHILILNRKNILVAIMCVELLLLAVNFNFILFSLYLDDMFGFIFVLFVLTIAASESALGLAILTVYYKLKNSILLESIKNNNLKFNYVFNREKRDLNPQSST